MRNYVEDTPQTEEQAPLLKEMSQDILLDLLHLDPNIVRVNRAGKLTADQQAFVRQQMTRDSDGTRLLTNIFLGTAILLAVIFIMQSLSMSYLLVGGLIFLGSFALYVTSRWNSYKRDLETRVGKATGDLRLIRSDSLAQWGLLIDDKFFPISEGLAQKFDGYRYPFVAAYYTLGTNTLLSMEVLPFEKRKNDDLEDVIEQPLASWDKPKNQLTVDDTPENKTEAETEPQPAEQDQAQTSQSKRRF